jgi:hypothetical protein
VAERSEVRIVGGRPTRFTICCRLRCTEIRDALAWSKASIGWHNTVPLIFVNVWWRRLPAGAIFGELLLQGRDGLAFVGMMVLGNQAS